MKKIRSLSNDKLKYCLFILVSLFIWFYGSLMWSSVESLESKRDLQMRRTETLLAIIQKYKELPDVQQRHTAEEDPMVIVSTLVDKMELKDNLIQISALSDGISIQLTRLYFKEAIAFLERLSKEGLKVDSAEIRYIPDGGKRLISMTLIVTVSR